MTTGPRSRTALVALKALVAAGGEEINALLKIIEAPDATYTSKQQALKDLATLTSSLTLRAADLEERHSLMLVPQPRIAESDATEHSEAA